MKWFIICLFAVLAMNVNARMKKEEVRSRISYVSMRSTACSGRCPDYKIELYNTGLVRYTGYSYVKDTGVYESYIGATQIVSLFQNFEYCQVDTCMTDYDANNSNPPGLQFSFNYKANMRSIQNADKGPHFLRQLAGQIDAAIKVDGNWKKVSGKLN